MDTTKQIKQPEQPEQPVIPLPPPEPTIREKAEQWLLPGSPAQWSTEARVNAANVFAMLHIGDALHSLVKLIEAEIRKDANEKEAEERNG